MPSPRAARRAAPPARAPQVFWPQCKPMYAFSERIADWLMHGYHADEICSKLRMCIPGFFDDKEN